MRVNGIVLLVFTVKSPLKNSFQISVSVVFLHACEQNTQVYFVRNKTCCEQRSGRIASPVLTNIEASCPRVWLAGTTVMP